MQNNNLSSLSPPLPSNKVSKERSTLYSRNLYREAQALMDKFELALHAYDLFGERFRSFQMPLKIWKKNHFLFAKPIIENYHLYASKKEKHEIEVQHCIKNHMKHLFNIVKFTIKLNEVQKEISMFESEPCKMESSIHEKQHKETQKEKPSSKKQHNNKLLVKKNILARKLDLAKQVHDNMIQETAKTEELWQAEVKACTQEIKKLNKRLKETSRQPSNNKDLKHKIQKLQEDLKNKQDSKAKLEEKIHISQYKLKAQIKEITELRNEIYKLESQLTQTTLPSISLSSDKQASKDESASIIDLRNQELKFKEILKNIRKENNKEKELFYEKEEQLYKIYNNFYDSHAACFDIHYKFKAPALPKQYHKCVIQLNQTILEIHRYLKGLTKSDKRCFNDLMLQLLTRRKNEGKTYFLLLHQLLDMEILCYEKIGNGLSILINLFQSEPAFKSQRNKVLSLMQAEKKKEIDKQDVSVYFTTCINFFGKCMPTLDQVRSCLAFHPE